MKQFRLVDNIVGWLTFFIAAFVYCSTIEPTASFWDCPEFITTGYRMEVGHPPGAPFFMLTANLFSQFASNPSTVAYMVNMMSALLSATCILFLFWSITHLARRLLLKDEDLLLSASTAVSQPSALNSQLWKLITIEGSGLVGALIYTFSDTFWFSAVEGEVYAYSSAFTAVVFWLILKWEEHADEPHSDRWLVLIMYMTGLSIGVHLLNLLCLPAIVLVWYFKRFPNANLKGSVAALVISFVLLAAVLYGVVPGIITVGGWFELFFVNTLGMPFNTGEYIYIILLVALVIWAIYETQMAKPERQSWIRQNVAFLLAFGMLGIPFYGFGWSAFFIGILVLAVLAAALFYRSKEGPLIPARLKNTTLLCMLMLMIGYSSYAVIVIRSSANPPMDQNSPEDIFTLGNYLSRDQYGYRPLVWGQSYNSEYKIDDNGRVEMDEGAPMYQRREKASADEPDSYFVVSTKDKPVYAQNMLFPRMYSSDPRHVQSYESWLGGIEGNQRPSNYRRGSTVKIPTQWENLRFFLSYQCNWMYWRYFLWNFAGRQNDVQGHGELEHGNWLTGIPFIDNARLGDQSLLPDELKQNKGHNVFYCLPLILGLLGILWQLTMRGQKGVKQFWVVFFLFFMTGLAIVVYLNQTPQQPRERDYAYAGSFYAYAIWCGLGVAAIIDMLTRIVKQRLVVAAIVSVACLLVPIQMGSQTWDDHDRSGRYTCRDFGQNYLMTLQEQGNPIIFTNGDNDTFPLWYNQDTEGVRTDARVCNLSYLQTDWYIDQMLRPAYDSPSLPITWSRLEYCSGTNEYVRIDSHIKEAINLLSQMYPEETREIFGDNPFELKNVLNNWVRNRRDPMTRKRQKDAIELAYTQLPSVMNDQYYDLDQTLQVIPTDTLYVTIDKEAVKRSGMKMQGDSIPDRMVISLKGLGSLDKSKLMMLEMLANANWERPIYVAYTVGQENYMNLGDNFVQEGLANRITPFTTNINSKPVEGMTDFDTEKTYHNVMERYKYGGANTPGIYLDETVMRMCYTHRRLMVKLAQNLVLEGDSVKAAAVLDRAEQEFPSAIVPHDWQSSSIEMAQVYATLGNKEKATEVLDQLWNKSDQYMTFYNSLDKERFASCESNCQFHMLYIMRKLIGIADMVDTALADKYEARLEEQARIYIEKGGNLNY
ncbi:MAG: DUF2723 domain-containing protein [Prevotella sp.]|nr:DUF2723 domain-containing protein [Prevotella sp.]